MIQLGKILFLMGAGSFVLNFVGFEFKLLMWIDEWGTDTGNVIRFGMIGSGAALVLLGLRLATSGTIASVSAATSVEAPQSQA